MISRKKDVVEQRPSLGAVEVARLRQSRLGIPAEYGLDDSSDGNSSSAKEPDAAKMEDAAMIFVHVLPKGKLPVLSATGAQQQAEPAVPVDPGSTRTLGWADELASLVVQVLCLFWPALRSRVLARQLQLLWARCCGRPIGFSVSSLLASSRPHDKSHCVCVRRLL